MKLSPWLAKHLSPSSLKCPGCGAAVKNISILCSACRCICPQCGGKKDKSAKRCRQCYSKRTRRKRGPSRKNKGRSIPTLVTLEDGTEIETRSQLEAAWIKELQHCGLICYECRPLPCTQLGKNGLFLGSYLPDLLLEDSSGREIHVELKPNRDQAKNDSRSQRALRLDNSLTFLIVGGYPDDNEGFYLRMLSSNGSLSYDNVSMAQLTALLSG